jgi:hypothetical protein
MYYILSLLPFARLVSINKSIDLLNIVFYLERKILVVNAKCLLQHLTRLMVELEYLCRI